MPLYQKLLTTAEVALSLRVSTRTVRMWALLAKLTGVRVGGQWRFHAADIEKFARLKDPSRNC